MQCLWKKVQNIGLTALYKENEEIGLTLRKCVALTSLKPEDEDLWMNSYSKSCSTQCEDDKVLGLLCRPMAAELVYPIGNVGLLQRSP